MNREVRFLEWNSSLKEYLIMFGKVKGPDFHITFIYDRKSNKISAFCNDTSIDEFDEDEYPEYDVPKNIINSNINYNFVVNNENVRGTFPNCGYYDIFNLKNNNIYDYINITDIKFNYKTNEIYMNIYTIKSDVKAAGRK